MGWSYQELMDTPYETYLDFNRIISLEEKEEMKKKNNMEQKMQ